jgi:putative transposase
MHHVVQRGHDAQEVFRDDADRLAYLAALQEALRTHELVLHAHALLDNQVQLLLTPATETALSQALQSVGRRYGGLFNRRHGRSGTLWDGRFRAGVVQAGPTALACLLAVDSLAVRQGQADAAQSSRWTSAPHRLGVQREVWLADPPEYWQLGNTPFEREAAYAALLAQGLAPATLASIDHAAANGWVLGSAAFVAQVERAAGRPVRPRAKGRPPRRLAQR